MLSNPKVWAMIFQGSWATIYMTLISTVLAYVIGLPLGIILVVTDKKGIHPIRPLNTILNIIVNIMRSIPFLILMIAIIPFTRAVVGSAIGEKATIVALVVSAAPFIARMVESSLKEVDSGVIEAAQSMGASTMQIITKVFLTEALPSLITGAAISVTTILGYSAMAGVVGGTGLGAIAINYGYHRYKGDVMWVCVALLVIIVQALQEFGMWFARKSDKRI